MLSGMSDDRRPAQPPYCHVLPDCHVLPAI